MENQSLKEKLRMLTEDLRFFQKIYGSKFKRRQKLMSKDNSLPSLNTKEEKIYKSMDQIKKFKKGLIRSHSTAVSK